MKKKLKYKYIYNKEIIYIQLIIDLIIFIKEEINGIYNYYF